MHRFDRTILSVISAALLPVAGCGTGEYMERMANRAAQLETAGEFESNLGADLQSVTADVRLRLPAIFNAESKAWQPTSQDESGQTINLLRLQPTICTLPGLTTTFERFLAEGEKSFPHYCYFAAVTIPENQKPEDFKAAIEAEIARSGASGGKFSPVSITGPTGAAQNWDLLSVTSLQRFAGAPPSGPEISMEGRFDLYFRATGTHFVLVGWRAPTGATAATFFSNAKLAMGTVQ